MVTRQNAQQTLSCRVQQQTGQRNLLEQAFALNDEHSPKNPSKQNKLQKCAVILLWYTGAISAWSSYWLLQSSFIGEGSV